MWKNPEHLTERQAKRLAWIAEHEPEMHRAYLLKEDLRLVFQVPPDEAAATFDWWHDQAAASGIAEFVDLARRLAKRRDTVLAAVEHGLTNARVESLNTRIRLLTRTAFGFHTAAPLIALAMLHLGGHRPHLPGRDPRISQ